MAKSQQYIFPDGGLYYGELNENGLPESEMASCMWENGRSYMGCWVNGKMSGFGTLIENGRETYGYWWNGELQTRMNPPSPQESPSQPSYNPVPYEPDEPDEPDDSDEPDESDNRIVALLVGNCDYGGDNDLKNCIEDTKAVEAKLDKIGIDVVRLENATKDELEVAIGKLCQLSFLYENVIFYFSGHGCTYQGHHLICTTPGDGVLCLEAIEAALRCAGFKYRILIEDACNDIVSERGPVRYIPPTRFNDSLGGSLMAFATGLGQSASDGILGKHSPFTFALLRYLDVPNIGVIDLFNNVYEATIEYCRRELGHVQEPYLIQQHIPNDFTLYPL